MKGPPEVDLTSEEEAATTAAAAGRPLGQRALHGVILTAAFALGIEALKAAAGLLSARLLLPSDFGVAGVAIYAIALVAAVFNLDVESRLIQAKTSPDESYDYAFTLQCVAGLGYGLLAVAAGPVLARVYGVPVLVPVCAVLALQAVTLPGLVPLAVLQRDLDWMRQRLVGSVGPVLGAVATVTLALQHAGVWALIVGQVLSALAGPVVLWGVVRRRPRLRWPIPRQDLRFFLSFGWPLWVGGLLWLASSNGMILEVKLALGLTVLGYFRVATGLGERIDTAERVLSSVLFPVICRLTDPDHLRRAFNVSARMLLLWAVPTGLGLAVFATDLVHIVLGPRWEQIIPLVRVEGVVEVFNSIATMWALFYAAAGNTRPSLWLSLQVNLLLLASIGIAGFLFGIVGVAGVVGLASLFSLYQRRRLVQRLFPGLPVVRPALPLLLSGLLASAIAVALTGLVGTQGWPSLALRLAAFAAVFCAGAWLVERRLILEGISLMRRDRTAS
ncbi:MAG: oligosaccharide flippase family protein [Candidatus Dormibacteria bacterium]